jgi:phosphoserine phosphatase RsbU/P
MNVPVADPVADPERLAAVFASELLDTPPEDDFDDLTRMAALVVGAPFAFATVVDDERSFWKSRYGVPPEGPKQNQVEESFCKYVVRTQRELIVTDASIDERTRDNPSVAAMGVRAWAGFPLLAPGGEVLGSFCIVDTAPREWTPRDLEVIRTLAAAASREVALRAAVASERSARQSAEALVHTLQQSLLPPALPEVPGLDVAGRFHPAGNGLELVGDFYDLFASRTDRWSFLVGDVCGKGVEAAKVAALARHTVGSSSMRDLDTPEVLRWLNETLLARGHAPHEFLTAVYGTLVRAGNAWIVRLCCAGHPPPILRRANGETVQVDAGGPLIGVFADFAIEEVTLRLDPGDALIVCTDGITEARAGYGLFGEDALLALIASADASAGAAAIAQQIEDAALRFSNGVAADDIAVLVIRAPA